MRVAIVVDNPFRDLPGLVLVGAMLARAGAICHLVPMMRQDLELRALAPDAVLLNYLRPTNAELARQLADSGVVVSVLDTEGPQLGDVAYFDRTQPDDTSLHRDVDTFFAWGPLLAEHCMEKGWFRPEQIVVSGHPRFDFYAEPWRVAALASSPYAAGAGERMVLVAASFPLVNPQFASPKSERELMVESFGGERQAVERWQERQRLAMRGLIEAVQDLASRVGDATFVVRPHPFERAETYDAEFAMLENVYVDRRGGIEGWILRSAAVIQRGSTAAIDASMAGVPALSLDWLARTDPDGMVDIPAIRCHAPDELERLVRLALEGSLIVPPDVRLEAKTAIDDWFHAVDGLASERITTRLLGRTADRDRREARRRCAGIGLTRPGATHGESVPWGVVRRWAKAAVPPDVAAFARGSSQSPLRPSDKHFDEQDVLRLVRSIGQSDPSLGAENIAVSHGRGSGEYVRYLPNSRSVTLRSTEKVPSS